MLNKKWQQALKNAGKILLVENSNGRIRATVSEVNNIRCVASNESEMNKALRLGYGFDTIMLDYNLTRIWKPWGRQNSLRALKSGSSLNGVKRVIIHSWNPWGARRLAKYIRANYLDIEVIVLRHWRVM